MEHVKLAFSLSFALSALGRDKAQSLTGREIFAALDFTNCTVCTPTCGPRLYLALLFILKELLLLLYSSHDFVTVVLSEKLRHRHLFIEECHGLLL